ncbi:MAG: MraY family glycosyltransferase [Nitrospira sp.]
MWQIDTILTLFFGAMAVAIVGTLIVLWKKGNLGIDKPDKRRKHHSAPISRFGGLPIFIALSVGYVALSLRQPEFARQWMPIILCNVIIFAVGFIDDLRPLGARIKLLGQVGAALILYAQGISIDGLSNPFGPGYFSLGWLSLPLTVLWLVAIPNIINLIDGMDGLATGFGMFLCVTLAFVGHYAAMPDVALMATVMAGALAGFLIFNFPPARIFLGDGGAYMIGFFIASASLRSSHKGTVVASLLVMLIALGVPILDTLFAIVRRALRGLPIFRADAEHIHHRLILLGFSKAKALVALYSICLVLSITGISIFWSRGLSLPISGAVVCLLGLALARYLGYVKRWRDVRQQLWGFGAPERNVVLVDLRQSNGVGGRALSQCRRVWLTVKTGSPTHRSANPRNNQSYFRRSKPV